MRAGKLKTRYGSVEEAIRAIATYVNYEPIFTVTLTSATASTVVSNAFAGGSSHVCLTPLSSDAATEPVWISTRAQGSFTIAHSSGNSTRTYSYTIQG